MNCLQITLKAGFFEKWMTYSKLFRMVFSSHVNQPCLFSFTSIGRQKILTPPFFYFLKNYRVTDTSNTSMGKWEKNASKKKILKGCHQGRQNVTVLANLEHLELKSFFCRPPQCFLVFHGLPTLKSISRVLNCFHSLQQHKIPFLTKILKRILNQVENR